jgi:hypothetical protein
MCRCPLVQGEVREPSVERQGQQETKKNLKRNTVDPGFAAVATNPNPRRIRVTAMVWRDRLGE